MMMKMIILISENEDEDFDNEDGGDDHIDYPMVIAVVIVPASEESQIDQCNDKIDRDGKLKADDDYTAH